MNYKKSIIIAVVALLVSFTSNAQQATGAFIAMDGGMEGQPVGAISKTTSSSKPVATWARSTATGKCTINNIVGTGGRTGNNFLSFNDTITTTTGSVNIVSPALTSGQIVGGASYVIQFYYRATDLQTLPSTTLSVGISNASGTAVVSTSWIPNTVSDNANWLKSTNIVTAANAVTAGTGFSLVKLVGSSTNNAKGIDIDDWVVYPGIVVDTIAPAPPGTATVSNPTANSLTVSWNASVNIDSGGYLVVRYTADPTGQPDPNVNGVYSIGNTVGSGTVAYTGTALTFIDHPLQGNTNYWYRIYTVDKAFNYSTNVLTSGATNGVISSVVYYIDATNGNDTNSGTSPATPWQSITKVNSTKFSPTDSILFKCGEVWSGVTLHPLGSGTSGYPIVISKYGTGNLPRIVADSNGVHNTAGIYLYNQQFITVSNLEVTNNYAASMTDTIITFGVHVVGNNIGLLRGISLINLVVHDVSGAYDSTPQSGGIFCQITGSSTISTFDSLLIQGCTIYNVDRTGIATLSSWEGRDINGDYGTTPWRPSTNVFIRYNNVDSTAGNGIIIRDAQSPVVEHNLVWKCGYKYTGNAIFAFNCNDALIQYNEVAYTVYNPGDVDASALDGDYRCHRTVFQYNYTHDNDGGFAVAVCAPTTGNPGTFDDSTVFRYNISQNDGHHNGGSNNLGMIISVTGQTTNSFFYNNSIYSSTDFNHVILERPWGGTGSVYPNASFFYNNIFYLNQKNPDFAFQQSTNNVLNYNVYYEPLGGTHPIDSNAITTNPQFVTPDGADTGLASAAAYSLLSTSPCINSGITISGAPKYDFFNNPVPYNGATDRGAIQFVGTVPVTLTMFRASADISSNTLLWNTFTEINNTGFEIERSADGVEFTSFSFVATKAINGTSNFPLQYSYIDKSPFSNITYYRLKQIDKNGNIQYSSIVEVINTNIIKNVVSVYPNPVENHVIFFSINNSTLSCYRLSLLNESGMVIMNKEINYQPGQIYQLSIPDGVSSGLYILKVESVNFLKSINLIIK